MKKEKKVESSFVGSVIAKQVLSEVQKGFKGAKYEIGGKKVSEYRFFKTMSDEIKGKKKKETFYWTDEKVLLLLECLDIKITKETLVEFKSYFR